MAGQQQEEIETIRSRTIEVKLSDADVKRISEKAAAHGLTVGELIENFIGDLVCGTYSNGSDERMYAEQWFERCWFLFLIDEFPRLGKIEAISNGLATLRSKKIHIALIVQSKSQLNARRKKNCKTKLIILRDCAGVILTSWVRLVCPNRPRQMKR